MSRDHTAFFYLGELIEFGDTARSSPPRRSRPEDYVTGRSADGGDDMATRHPGHALKACDLGTWPAAQRWS